MARTPHTDDKQQIRKKAVDFVNRLGSFNAAAAKLNADKVPTLGRSKQWGWHTVRQACISSGLKWTTKPQPKGRAAASKRTTLSPKRTSAARKEREACSTAQASRREVTFARPRLKGPPSKRPFLCPRTTSDGYSLSG